NTSIYILDEDNQLQTVGVFGELYITGNGLSRGYLNNPDLTAEKFIPHPFKNNQRLYKTGDLARWLPDGNIEFLGRKDFQLKIRGYRIEAGEIEQILLAHQAIQSAVVIGYDFENGKELVAYLVPKEGQEIPNITTLRSYLGESLPDYMIPGHFVELENLPLTSSGKVNRKALPKPNISIGTGTTYVAPRNTIETQLVEIWKAVLNKEQIGVFDNFFALGGHSLRAIRLVSLIKQELSVEIKLSEIFASPTIADLGQKIADLKHLHPIILQPIPKVEKSDNYALSNAQRRLWVLDKMDDNLTAYNMPAAIRLHGDLDIEALEKTFQYLFDRHEVLRTRFVSIEGEGRQIIDKNIDFKLEIIEVNNENEINELAQNHANHAFDLENEHLLKIKLLRINKTKHVLLFNMHHIISDGWSMGILIKEISRTYEKTSSDIRHSSSELPIQYKDYAAWQNNLLENEEVISELRNYWQNQLTDLPTLELPLDFKRPKVKTYNGASVQHTFSKAISEKLNVYSQENEATLFMTLTALVKVLLYRYTNQTDIVIGTPTAGRNHPDLHNQIGFYINTLVLRNQIEPTDNFKTVLSKVKQTALQAFENELYPFDKLVEELDIPRDMSRNAVFDVMVVLQNNEQADLSFGDVEIEVEETETNIAKFDLTINFTETENSLVTNINYNTDLFRNDRIERMIGHLETLINSVFDN
ncbi:MAG: AMP-binding protein, partial [Bdellovibrionales bacterium]|nr:AMP-binding protein [Bdellovibrionales bacterium]